MNSTASVTDLSHDHLPTALDIDIDLIPDVNNSNNDIHIPTQLT